MDFITWGPTTRRTGIILVGLLSASTAAAQVTGDQVNTAFDIAQAQKPGGQFGGLATFGRLDEDFFMNVILRLSFDQENWGIGLQAPLRLRIVDNDPQDDDDIGSIIRREDWDQPSDILRLLRYVYIGQRDKKGPFYIRLGELNGLSIGHGTIMHRYFNNFDVSRWRAGLNAAVNVGGVGVEVMISDLLDYHVVGGRVTIRPLRWVFGEESFWERFVVGASVIADTKAPFTLAVREDDPTTPDIDEAGQVQVNDQDEPVVLDDRAFTIAGFDVGFELVRTDLLSITPYMDFNKMLNVVDQGWGWHLGVLWNFRVPMVVDTFVADLRTEYRRVSGDYLAPYFNTIYEIERYGVLSANGAFPQPRLRCLASVVPDCPLNAGETKNGFFFEALVGLPNWIYIGGEYLDYDGDTPDGQLRLSLEVPLLEFVQFSAFYYRVNVDGASDLFRLDDKSALVAQATIPIYAIIALQARWWRVWRADPEVGYASVDDWSVGVGFSYSF